VKNVKMMGIRMNRFVIGLTIVPALALGVFLAGSGFTGSTAEADGGDYPYCQSPTVMTVYCGTAAPTPPSGTEGNATLNDIILNDLLNSTNQIENGYNSGTLTDSFMPGWMQPQVPDYMGSINRQMQCALYGGSGCDVVIDQAQRMSQVDAGIAARESTFSDVYESDRDLMSDRFESEFNQLADREFTRFENLCTYVEC
jgi:hypothetical protein